MIRVLFTWTSCWLSQNPCPSPISMWIYHHYDDYSSGLILLIHNVSFTTTQCSCCADKDNLKLKWLASELQHALFPVYWTEWARVWISDTRTSLPTRIVDHFWYQILAQWLTEESLVSCDKDFRMAQWRRSGRSLPEWMNKLSEVLERLCDVMVL